MGEGDGKGKERRCGTSPVRARSDGTGAIEAPNPQAVPFPSPALLESLTQNSWPDVILETF
ncbi:hypothetical protein N7449_007714 [Penicillium cf. viridicatum]|uniref:Uncharacterized protein n=1 Tax=Penicillium cf. viridicatum TaxID=2972119 RepID=A0A9W9JLQ1_9EURO|nr:hypothetical protein N7449_007714 [Penicillium cf. viridicatum]